MFLKSSLFLSSSKQPGSHSPLSMDDEAFEEILLSPNPCAALNAGRAADSSQDLEPVIETLNNNFDIPIEPRNIPRHVEREPSLIIDPVDIVPGEPQVQGLTGGDLHGSFSRGSDSCGSSAESAKVSVMGSGDASDLASIYRKSAHAASTLAAQNETVSSIYETLSERRQIREELEAICSKEDPTVLCRTDEAITGIGFFFGKVCRAEFLQKRPKDPTVFVALERIELTNRSFFDRRFSDELKIARGLYHPNIARLYEVYLPNANDLWMMSEFVEGIHLSDLRHCHSVNEQHMATIYKYICRALQYYHSHNIVANGISNASVVITMKGQVKFLGLGRYTKLTEENKKCQKVINADAWEAPEIVGTDGYDTKADIWSLGMMILDMLMPDLFSSSNTHKTINEILENGLPDLDHLQVSSGLRKFLTRCLSLDSNTRASADELLEHEFLLQATSTDCLVPLVWTALEAKQKIKDMIHRIKVSCGLAKV